MRAGMYRGTGLLSSAQGQGGVILGSTCTGPTGRQPLVRGRGSPGWHSVCLARLTLPGLGLQLL